MRFIRIAEVEIVPIGTATPITKVGPAAQSNVAASR